MTLYVTDTELSSLGFFLYFLLFYYLSLYFTIYLYIYYYWHLFFCKYIYSFVFQSFAHYYVTACVGKVTQIFQKVYALNQTRSVEYLIIFVFSLSRPRFICSTLLPVTSLTMFLIKSLIFFFFAAHFYRYGSKQDTSLYIDIYKFRFI